MTEVGTLKELNVQPGDVVEYRGCDTYTVILGEKLLSHQTGKTINYMDCWNWTEGFRLISRATPTIRLEVGKRYELNNGEVHECTHMNGSDPLAVDKTTGYGPFVIDGLRYHQDGRFANPALPDGGYSVKRCVEPAKTLQLEEGKYYMTADGRKAGPMYKYSDGTYDCDMDAPLGEQVWCADGSVWTSLDEEPNDYLIAEWYPARDQELTSPYGDNNHPLPDRDTPKTWGEMTDAEKAAIALEYVNKNVECSVNNISWHKPVHPFGDMFYYRVRPEPKRETVTIYGCGMEWGQASIAGPDDTHKITITRNDDGSYDCASIKMERING